MPLPWQPNRRTALLGTLGSLLCTARAQGLALNEVPWPRALAAPGGVVRLALGSAPGRPQATADGAPLLVLGHPPAWIALVGVPLSATPGVAVV